MLMQQAGSSQKITNSSRKRISNQKVQQALSKHTSATTLGRFFWGVSLDGNFWFGTTALNGVPNPETLQRSSRVGGTASIFGQPSILEDLQYQRRLAHSARDNSPQ